MPARTSDIDDAASRIARSIEGESKSNMPQPVTLNVTDGAPQKTAGWVWATRGDHQVQVIASMGIGDLSAATPTTPITIWAYPPNPGEPNQPYFGICITYDSVSGSRAPVIMATQYLNNTGSPIASGTVTSVALSMPGIFGVSGSPITASGTFSVSLATQSANTVFAGPTSGGAATPTFRSLVAGDIPSLSATYANVALSNLSGATSDMLTQYLLRQPTANWTIDSSALYMGALGGAAVAAQKLTIYTGADANKGLVVRGFSATQSANLQEWQNSTPTTKALITNSGAMSLGFAIAPTGLFSIGANPSSTTTFQVGISYSPTATSGTTAGLALQVTSSPSANMTGANYGLHFQAGTASAQSNNWTAAIGLIGIVGDVVHRGSGTITGSAAYVINNPVISGGGAITTVYGLYINSLSSGGTNYSIVTNAGNIVFNEGGDAASDVRFEGDTLANLFFIDASADSIGINTSTPNALTYFDVVGTAKSSRPAPGMTTAQRDALATPPDGALVYNTDSHRLTSYYNDAWVEFDDIIGWVA